MKKDNLVVLTNNNEVFLYNKVFGQSMKISTEVYNIIKDAETIEDVEKIAKEYSNDKDYFDSLIKILKETKMLENYEDDRIKKITFALTNLCNLSCTHCCYSAGLIKEGMENKANLDVLKKIVEVNPMELSLTGGEPMSVSNFMDIVEFLNINYTGILTLATNATLITEENVKMLCDSFCQFDISLDGIDEESTDKIRGKGSYKTVIEKVKLLRKSTDKDIVLSMAIDNETKENETKFNDLCNELGVKPMIRTMNMTGRAKNNHIDSDEIVQFMKGSTANIVGCYDCLGGVKEIFVDPCGDVYPCSNFHEDKFKIGNILEDGWTNKLGWNKAECWFKEFGEYIPDTREECSDCEVRTFCWSCPSLAKSFLESHKINSFKEICGKKKQEIMEAIWNG